jgi:hypothetical protein
MFLRAPKHFKVGKQFITKYQLNYHKALSLSVTNTSLLLQANPLALYNMGVNFDKNTTPGLTITKVTYKCPLTLR